MARLGPSCYTYCVPPGSPHGFARLALTDWRQFAGFSIEFDPRLSILTGENGTGKTTILALLALHFSWQREYSSSPIREDSIADADRPNRARWTNFGSSPPPDSSSSGSVPVGSITYSDGNSAALQVPVGQLDNPTVYNVTIPQYQGVVGVYVTAHSAIVEGYAPLQSLPPRFGQTAEVLEKFTNQVRIRALGGYGGQDSPKLALKSALLAAALYSEGNSSVEVDPVAEAVWFKFQDVLRQVFPDSLGFERLRVRQGEIVVQTQTGDFILDEASGGLNAIVETTWQIYLCCRAQPAATILIDEPENHLHPKLQRELMPGLLSAFQQAQFIVATHSPFVVTATRDAAVYTLVHETIGERRLVAARRLDEEDRSGTADDTLRDVLGMESTTPHWAEQRFESLMSEFLTSQATPQRIEQLRSDLVREGMSERFASALVLLSRTGRGRTSGGNV